MPLVYNGWTLYKREVYLKKGPKVTIYFFSKIPPKSGVPCDIPPGREVGVNKRTGLPYLRAKQPIGGVSGQTLSTFLAEEHEVVKDLEDEG